MFSLGTGAAVKLDIDITSEFALLPDAPLSVDQTLNNINNLGHSSHSSTPIPTGAWEKPSDQAMSDEAFFDGHVGDLELSRNHDAPEPADELIEPPGAAMAPEETAALAEMHRLRTALTNSSSYGAGVNSAGIPCRRRPDSKRSSDVLPEAWANFGESQRKSV